MKLRLTVAIVTASMFFSVTSFASSSHVRDWADVVEAIDRANLGGGGIISLVNGQTLFVDRELPTITSHIVIEGNGATIEPENEYSGGLVQIAHGAYLDLRGVHITKFNRGASDQLSESRGFIDNFGSLNLEAVTFSANVLCDDCEESMSLLSNRSLAWLNNVTMYQNFTRENAIINNCGEMRVVNSTIIENDSLTYTTGGGIIPVQGWYSMTSGISACEGSVTEIGNTILDNIGANCLINGSFVDLGGNVDSRVFCGFDPTTNSIGSTAKMGSFGQHGGLVPTKGLEPGNPAIDAGNNDICSATDARFASRPVAAYLGSEPKCDAGAFEYGGAFGNADLAVNGMNGLWFSKAADGHYIHVWRVSSDRVYLNWTAFDDTADQMWIYAVADTVGERQFVATAYINEGGQLIAGGAPEGSEVSEWGNVELEFSSCNVGMFRYEALDSTIGSGEFQIDRLAFVEGGGCSID